jgi:spartin
VELACGDFFIVSLKQGDTIVAVFARVGDDIQWPLANDEAAVKLDGSHYFFTLWVPGNESGRGELNKGEVELLNYGVTFASKGQEGLLKELDKILECYSSFSVQEVNESGGKWEVLDGSVAEKISPDELEKKKELTEKSSAAYWTVLAPNVEDYSSSIARLIAAGSGQLIKGIFWCGDVTVDRLKWGNEFFKIRIDKSSDSDISPGTLRRIKRFGFTVDYWFNILLLGFNSNFLTFSYLVLLFF